MAIRFDLGTIGKVEITPEGFLRCEATFARDGILEYQDGNGKIRREFRSKEVNSNPLILKSYGSRPITVEHPPTLLDTKNAKDHAVGMTESFVRYNPMLEKVDGGVVLFDAEAIEYAQSGKKVELSAGYQCDLDPTPGEWKGERFDASQINVRVNHVCLTEKGRAGNTVRLHLDSFNELIGEEDVAFETALVKADAKSSGETRSALDSADRVSQLSTNRRNDNLLPLNIKNMETTVIRIDNVDCPGIPMSVAPLIGSKIRDYEQYKSRLDSIEPEFEKLKADITTERDNSDRHRGRADALEIELEEMRYVLEQARTDGADAHKCKDCGKMVTGKNDDDEDEDEDEDWEEMSHSSKSKKSKSKKMDSSDDTIALEVEKRIGAWAAAEETVPNILEEHFNPSLDASSIQKLVLSHFDSSLNYEGLSEAYIQGRFDSLVAQSKEKEVTRTDSNSNAYTNEMALAISASRSAGNKSPLQAAQTENRTRVANNWETPLAFSKRK